MTNKKIELLVGLAEELIQLGDSRQKSFGYGMIFILKKLIDIKKQQKR
jgi:hypothetical protein